jgi:hypothetical protein
MLGGELTECSSWTITPVRPRLYSEGIHDGFEKDEMPLGKAEIHSPSSIRRGIQRAMLNGNLLHGSTLSLSTQCVSNDTNSRVSQVKVVFRLPKLSDPRFQPLQSKHLAYIEWFSQFRELPGPPHGLYKVTRNPQHERWEGEVIEVSKIRQSVHLFPCFSGSWNSDNLTVLKKCDAFFVNRLQSRRTYLVMSNYSTNNSK